MAATGSVSYSSEFAEGRVYCAIGASDAIVGGVRGD